LSNADCADDCFGPTRQAAPVAVGGGRTLWALAMGGPPVIGWLDHLLRQADRPDLAPLTWTR